MLGGEPIDASKLSEWVRSPNFRATITNSYGPTEFTDVVSSHELDAGDLRPDGRAIPIGRPVDGINLFVLTPQRRLCAPHMVGELYLGGAGRSKGYINDPEEQRGVSSGSSCARPSSTASCIEPGISSATMTMLGSSTSAASTTR